jgi:DNA invertase Pin-like site-specific DNA recombinase
MEADLIKKRTKAGLAAARARGIKGGRLATDPKVLEKAIKLYHSKTYSIKETTEITGVSKAKLYQELKETK